MKLKFYVADAVRWSITLALCLLATGSAWALEGPSRVSSGRPEVALHTRLLPEASGPNDAVLGYDSGPVYYFPEATLPGSFWGVRFSPTQACSLLTVEVYAFSGSGSVTFHFYDDVSGQPGTEIAPSQTYTLAGDLSQETVTLAPVELGAGDFYIAMEIVSGPPPYPVTDADGGTGRSWFHAPEQPWEQVPDFDITLRAGVRYYGPDMTGPEIVHIPVTLGFADEPATEIPCRLSDPSGISSGWALYRPQGATTFDSAALSYEGGNDWSAELPVYPAGDHIEYFVRAYDDAGTKNAATFPAGAPDTVLGYTAYAGREINYDDGYPEMFLILDTVWTDNAFAVCMTPAVYPARVTLLRAFVSDTSAFDFEIRTRLDDSAGGLLAGPFTVRAAAPFTWVNFEIPELSQPTISAGDFMMVLRWKSATPATPAIGADSVVAAAGRSYSFDGVNGWQRYTMFDWMMRAGVQTPTGIIELGGGERPAAFELKQNVPNPFNPSTRIDFSLSEPAHVTLAVFNLLGQQVNMLVDDYFPAGEYGVDFAGRDARGHALPSGLYFYRLDTGKFHETRKMVLMK